MSVIATMANLATAVGALSVAWQISESRRQARVEFEQTFVNRYQTIIRQVALPVRLGESDDIDPSTLEALYDYFELCEEEFYFRKHGKVLDSTWQEWMVGMRSNFARPTISAAFHHIVDRVTVSATNNHGTTGVADALVPFEHLRKAFDDTGRFVGHDPLERRGVLRRFR